MYRMPHNPDLSLDRNSWKGCTWRVTLQINARHSVIAVEGECIRVDAEGLMYEGYHQEQIAPFDDLRKAIRNAVVESGINSHKDVGMQVSLFDAGPFD